MPYFGVSPVSPSACFGQPVSVRVHAGRSAEEVLSAEQLCLRRLDNIRQLKELYETELLNTLEEQRSRHCRSQNVLPGNAPSFPHYSMPVKIGLRQTHDAYTPLPWPALSKIRNYF